MQELNCICVSSMEAIVRGNPERSVFLRVSGVQVSGFGNLLTGVIIEDLNNVFLCTRLDIHWGRS